MSKLVTEHRVFAYCQQYPMLPYQTHAEKCISQQMEKKLVDLSRTKSTAQKSCQRQVLPTHAESLRSSREGRCGSNKERSIITSTFPESRTVFSSTSWDSGLIAHEIWRKEDPFACAAARMRALDFL